MTLTLALTPSASAILGCGINPLCIVGKGVGAGVSTVAGDAITALAKSVLQALGHAVEWSATLWTGVGTPQLADANGQPVGAVAFVQQNLLYFTAGMAVASVLVGAAKIAIEEQKAYHARQLTQFLVVYGIIAAGSAALGSALVYASDQMAADLISKATANTGFANHMAQLLGLGGGAGGLAGLLAVAFAAIVLGIIAFLTTLLQIVLMFVRNGMLVLLIGILPLAAAMSNTEMGMHWFKKAWAWLIAFALYKPAAAVVYAVAFVLPGQEGINALMSGIMMLVLAVLALPALLRFVVPATAAVAGGSGMGGLAVGAAGAMVGMRMPTGAAPVEAAGAQGYETEAASTSSGGSSSGGNGATGAAAAGPQGPGGLDGSSGGDGRRGGRGPAGAAGGAGAAGTSDGAPGGPGASGAPGAAGNDAGTAAGAPSASAGGQAAGDSGGGGAAGAGSGASGASGGVAGAAMYGAYEGAQAIKRAGEQQAGDDGPTGADGRRS